MHALRLLSACAALLFASVAWAASGAAEPVDLSVRVASPSSFDIVTRYLCVALASLWPSLTTLTRHPTLRARAHRGACSEAVHRQRPDAFYPFLHSLTQYHLRPKRAVFSNPAFAPPPSGLDGKPIKTKYSDHNPVFTRLALANESLVALESTIARLDQWKKRVRGRYGDMHLGLAAQEDYPVLEAMRDVWTRREAEVEQPKTLKGECQSWADVGGYRACSMNEFWGHLGHKQGIERGPLKVQGCVPFSLALFDARARS